jgi:hypothetical protein
LGERRVRGIEHTRGPCRLGLRGGDGRGGNVDLRPRLRPRGPRLAETRLCLLDLGVRLSLLGVRRGAGQRVTRGIGRPDRGRCLLRGRLCRVRAARAWARDASAWDTDAFAASTPAWACVTCAFAAASSSWRRTSPAATCAPSATGTEVTSPGAPAGSSAVRTGTARPSATTPWSAGITPGTDDDGDGEPAGPPPNIPFATPSATSTPMTITTTTAIGTRERRGDAGGGVGVMRGAS